MNKGRLFVFSSPSGGGKSTILKELRTMFPNILYSISHTTRPKRENEVNGEDYFFVTRNEFKRTIENAGFLEWEEVAGNLYGTSRDFIINAIDNGKDVFMDIDVKGAKNIKKAYADAVLIFIMPPSIAILEKRLRKRGTESEESIRKRLELAEREIEETGFFDYVVVNDDLRRAIREIVGIIEREKARPDVSLNS